MEITMETHNKHTDTFIPVSTYKSVTSGSKYALKSQKNNEINKAIQLLRNSTSKTISPLKVAECLEIIFGKWEENPLIWSYRAKNYTVKSINSVILELSKTRKLTGIQAKTPGRLFNFLLKNYHPPRRHPKRKIYGDKIERNEHGQYVRKTNKKEGDNE